MDALQWCIGRRWVSNNPPQLWCLHAQWTGLSKGKSWLRPCISRLWPPLTLSPVIFRISWCWRSSCYLLSAFLWSVSSHVKFSLFPVYSQDFYQLNTMYSPCLGVVNSHVQLSNFKVTDFEETSVLMTWCDLCGSRRKTNMKVHLMWWKLHLKWALKLMSGMGSYNPPPIKSVDRQS